MPINAKKKVNILNKCKKLTLIDNNINKENELLYSLIKLIEKDNDQFKNLEKEYICIINVGNTKNITSNLVSR